MVFLRRNCAAKTKKRGASPSATQRFSRHKAVMPSQIIQVRTPEMIFTRIALTIYHHLPELKIFSPVVKLTGFQSVQRGKPHFEYITIRGQKQGAGVTRPDKNEVYKTPRRPSDNCAI